MCALFVDPDCKIAGRPLPDEVFVEKFDDDVIELEVAESDCRQGHRTPGPHPLALCAPC